MKDNRQFAPEMDTTLLDSLLAHIAIVDTEGTIQETNKAWQSYSKERTHFARAEPGTNYFELLQRAVEMGNDHALKFLIGMKKVLRGEKEDFTLTYPAELSEESDWFTLTLRQCNNDGRHFIMIHEDVTAAQQARKKQQESKNRYQVQFEQSLEGLLIIDAQDNIIDANPTACHILGRNHKELLTLSHDKVMDTADPNYQNALKKSRKTGIYKLEMYLLHKDGTKIPAEVSSRSYRTKDGKLRTIVTFHDISRRKQIERDLIKNRQFTELALNNNPGIFFVLDKKGNLVPWNDNFLSILGYTSNELSGKNALDFVVDEQREMVRAKIEQCIKTGELSLETKIQTKDGQIRDYHIQANRFEQDGTLYIVGSGTDITESKKIDREKRKNQQMVEQLFKNAPVGIAIVDTENKVQQINKEFEHIFEYTQEEIVGTNIDEKLVPQHKRKEAEHITTATCDGKSLQKESIRLKKNKQEVPVLIGSVPVELEGEVIAIYGIYVDISQQHEYQQKITSTLQEKETLLAELHHRVKNNLALISSMVELQIYDAETPQIARELTSTQKRIMTIAAIHEVLYQSGNLNSIPFNNFLDKLLETVAIQKETGNNQFSIKTDTQDIFLDINQSIPSGLFLTELLSLIFEDNKPDNQKEINILFRQYGNKIHIIVEGDSIIGCPIQLKEHTSLHNVLLETLVQQLDGELFWPNPENNHQKFELIFTKKNGNGPARKLLN